MKLPTPRIAAFLKAPDPSMRAALVYGPDAGLVRERADTLAAAISPDLKDAFRVAELDGARLKADPALLNDEAASLSLTGGRRLVRLRDADDAVGAIFDRFLKAPPPGDAFVVVESDDLPPRSSLRRAFEGAKIAAAIPCYLDDAGAIAGLAREVLGARKITLEPAAAQYLAAHLGGDRGVSRRELEKLALYVGDNARVSAEDAMAAVGDSAELTIDEVAFSAAEGDAKQLERALNRAFGEGAQPVTLIRAELKHFQRLHLAGSKLRAGESEDEALRFRPPLFFKLAERFKRQLALWPPQRAQAAMEALNEAEAQAKTTGLPPETICRAALMRVAQAAQRAQASRRA